MRKKPAVFETGLAPQEKSDGAVDTAQEAGDPFRDSVLKRLLRLFMGMAGHEVCQCGRAVGRLESGFENVR